MSKEITIPVPDGKRAEWINGVLTLVDEQKVDNRPVTERIKTFTDACNALGDDHPFVMQFNYIKGHRKTVNTFEDVVAYLKLRIIVAALNEGWEPKFEKDEYRYYPCLYLFTKEQYDELDDEEKGRCVLCSGGNTMYCNANSGASYWNEANGGSRLVFRTHELAAYAGRQFTEEWAGFVSRSESKGSGDDQSEKQIKFTTDNF